MQLFRSQLSRFSPHPHRDSWMRNHLNQWLSLLQWSTFITLAAAGWLTLKHQSPIGHHYHLDQRISTWFNISDPTIISYIMSAISALFFIGALCCFRCGHRYRPKYSFAVFLSGLIFVTIVILYSIESDNALISIATFILPSSISFLLLSYQVWKNKVDHWNFLVCFSITTTIASYVYQSLTNPTGIPTPSGIPIRMSELSIDLNILTVTSVAYIAIAAALGLYIAALRRLSLFLCITLAMTISGATIISYYSPSMPLLNLSLVGPMTLLTISYSVLPILVLLSLASRKKNKTLRI